MADLQGGTDSPEGVGVLRGAAPRQADTVTARLLDRITIAVQRIRTRILRSALPRLLRSVNRDDLVRIGSQYGGWTVPLSLLDRGSICYSGGVGEDATFDLGLIGALGCEVHAFDPTPRAIAYGRTIAEQEPRFRFFAWGLWSHSTTLRFYAPKDDTHVSHSVLNLQRTAQYFTASVKSIADVMEEFGHDHVDLVKIDIEGAEHAVLQSMLRHGIHPRIVCVEFDQPMPLSTVLSTIRRMQQHGYEIVSVEHWNYTFVRRIPEPAVTVT